MRKYVEEYHNAVMAVEPPEADRLFEVDPFRNKDGVFDDSDPDLLAAAINTYPMLVIGPADDQTLTQLEKIKLDEELRGGMPLVAQIQIGEKGTDVKEDLVDRDTYEHTDYRMVKALSVISRYDPVLAEQLIEPLGRELLVDRIQLKSGITHTFVRLKGERQEKLQRLAALANDETGLDQAYTQKLLEAAETFEKQYEDESARVLAETAALAAPYRQRNKRFQRYGLRVLSLVCSGVVLMGVAGLNSETGSEDLKARAKAEADYTVGTMNTAQDMILEGADPSVIIDATENILDDQHQDTLSLKAEASDSRDEDITETLEALDEDASLALEDNEITTAELSVLQSHEAQINVYTLPSSLPAKWMMGLVLVGGYACFAAAGFWAASRRGGRRDPAMKIYASGQLTQADWTSSSALNEQYNFRVPASVRSKIAALK